MGGASGLGTNHLPVKRKVENLARTGAEYPLMKMPHTFIRDHPEDEPLTEKACTPAQMNEYVMNDADRANNTVGTVIYDSVDVSPFYDNSPNDLYLDEKELIELPAPTQ